MDYERVGARARDNIFIFSRFFPFFTRINRLERFVAIRIFKLVKFRYLKKFLLLN